MKNEKLKKKLVRDKISQVYLGEWGSAVFQKQARDRIDWFMDQITFGKVLDIGCSEGILPILLGRKGINVLGIDINPESIEYAHELLTKELPETAKNVKFLCCNILDDNNVEDSFDFVVLGEVIEHFNDPEIIIQKAIEFLKPEGILLITTPFGVLPDPDHRFTFTLSNFLNFFINKNITPQSLDVVDGYIRFSLYNNPSGKNHLKVFFDQLLEKTEHGLLSEQRRLYEQIYDSADQRKDLYGKISVLSSQLAQNSKELKNQTGQYEKELRVQSEQYEKELKTKLEHYESKLRKISENHEKEIKFSEDKYNLLYNKYNQVLQSFTYKISRELINSFHPLKFSTFLFPIRIIKLLMTRKNYQSK